MTHQNNLTEQIQRFDRLRDTAEHFSEAVLDEWTDVGSTATFDSQLSDNVRAVANVDMDGGLSTVDVYVIEDGERRSMSVEPASGLWKAMEVWYAEHRRISSLPENLERDTGA
ncbi:hypothetical protein CGZ95_08870 [Enemella evansiae]|uniref:hypothetical protein n=1 Tax=Enemella evansiae TaxID=2016499 RepID=UPI000B961FD3|nr:hypothetical protein [Enemella evansiae]OYO00724.1 hypothetical protein CGZ95_08870 [Enemella evansiae]